MYLATAMASVPVISAASSPAEVKLWFDAQLLPANAKVDELEGLRVGFL